MIRKLINTSLAATLIILPIVNVGKAKAQNVNVDAYLLNVNQILDLYINSTLGAQESGWKSYLQTIQSTNCLITIQLRADLQNNIIIGAISPQNPLYQTAAKKIVDLRQMSSCTEL